MRRGAVVSVGALALAGACATTSTTMRSGAPLEIANASPRPERSGASVRGTIDSVYAQSIADQEGPRVSIRAEVSQLAASRRVRARFNVDDDAYVLIGHVDAGGVVRIVFPADANDDGFVQGGGRSYETAEVFGGFADQYAFRYANYGRYYGLQPQAYDGSGGYLFIVASWRPMHFEKFSSAGDWDSFEVTNEAYVRDPRPAIYEFASVLVGENREAYTVKFATYYNSLNSTIPGGYTGFSSFGLGMCSSSFFGFAQPIPWSYLSFGAPFLSSDLNVDQVFSYRGRRYYYDSLRGCATQLPVYYTPGITLAGRPGIPGRPTGPITGRARALSAFDSPRTPGDPTPPGTRIAPPGARDAGGASTDGKPVRISSEYRRRGLVTEDGPENPAPTRAPRIDAGERNRPSITQMTERRAQNGYEGSGYTRTRLGADDPQPAPIDRSQAVDRGRARSNDDARNGGNRDPERYSPRNSGGGGGSGGGDQGARSAPPPRREAPRAEPRTEQPRSEPRSTPPARTAEPKSEPKSSEPKATPSKPTP